MSLLGNRRQLWVLAMAILGFHLFHAFQSAFQTLSIRSKKVQKIGLSLCVIIASGFALLPISIYMAGN